MRLLAVLLCLLLLGAAPASQPASRLQTLVRELANPDSARRDEAFYELLKVQPKQLPALRDAVAGAGELLPSQISLLRQVVRHIYISGAEYPVEANAPFLGLSWDTQSMPEWAELGGVPVMRRVPGFSAFQVLREGDVIQGIEELPGITPRTTDDVRNAIGVAFRAGQTITLKIQRQGKTMRVQVLLRAKPVLPPATSGEPLDLWLDEQTAAADQYWEQHFSPLVDGNLI